MIRLLVAGAVIFREECSMIRKKCRNMRSCCWRRDGRWRIKCRRRRRRKRMIWWIIVMSRSRSNLNRWLMEKRIVNLNRWGQHRFQNLYTMAKETIIKTWKNKLLLGNSIFGDFKMNGEKFGSDFSNLWIFYVKFSSFCIKFCSNLEI